MKKIKIISFIFLVFFGLVAITSLAMAQVYKFEENSGLGSAAEQAGYETSDAETIEKYISPIINIVLSVLGVVFLILTIYGGILWMTATGNEEKVKKAKELITQAIIGLIIVLSSYAISYFVLNQLTETSLISNNPPQEVSRLL
jgi:lysylphosphatidylglycerol synthetase-like protein (DUF2156 family)